MTPEEHSKLGELHESAFEMRVMLNNMAESLKSIEPKLHFLEVRQGQQEVRIEHAEESYTGLANKLRKLDSIVRGPIGKYRGQEEEIGVWLRALNFAAENKAIVIGTLISSMGAIAWLYNFIVSGLHKLPLIPR